MIDEITVTQNSGLNEDYLITVRQFIDENYPEKIARGECRVYLFDIAPPAEDSSPSNKAAYEHLKQNGGLFNEVGYYEADSDGYVVLVTPDGLGHLGTPDDAELLVITRERWQVAE